MIKLEFIRETSSIHDKEANWLNRSVKDPESNVISPPIPSHPTAIGARYRRLTRCQTTLYFCEADPDSKLTIRRGGPDGPILATGEPCKTSEGSTEIFFHDSSTDIKIHHQYHYLPFTHNKTSFTYKDKQYHWKDHTELIDDASGEVVGKFHATWLEGTGHKIGTLEVKDAAMQDVVVVTAIVVQERSDERTLAAAMSFDAVSDNY